MDKNLVLCILFAIVAFILWASALSSDIQGTVTSAFLGGLLAAVISFVFLRKSS